MSLEQLRDQIRSTPISMIIGHFIPLHKRGANLEALCPFHADSNPSLKVNDAKGIYRCFVCDEGGDAIKFVKEYKKIDFIESLKTIANIIGFPFEEIKKEKKNPKFEMAQRVLNASNKVYQKFAAQNPKAYVDFLKRRQLNTESIQKFQIGFSPSNNALFNYLQTIPHQERDFALKTAIEIGIIKYHAEKKSTYDFYRERIMFPIHDHSGLIKGYSSRSIRDDQIPKYLNSGDSFIFHKASILFGLHFAKSFIRQLDQVIIVEGNMDVIMMHQFGFNQTIGTMGIALSDSSIKLISNMTKNIYLGMDSDPAGKKAMHRINADFMSHGILPKVIDFSPAKDPDEFLNTEGRLALLERIEKAPLLVDQLITEALPANPVENIEIKLGILKQIFDLISPLKENLMATEKLIQAASKLGLKSDNTTILNQYKDYLNSLKSRPVYQIPTPPKKIETQDLDQLENQPLKEELATPAAPALPIPNIERIFIKEMICHPEFLTHTGKDDFLALLKHDEVKKLFGWLVTIYSEIDDAEYVSIVQDELQYGEFSKELQKVGTEALFNQGSKYNDKVIQRMIKDFKLKLQMDGIKFKRKELVEKQRQLNSQSEIDQTLVEIAKLDKELLILKNSVP
jgi:DNA primase